MIEDRLWLDLRVSRKQSVKIAIEKTISFFKTEGGIRHLRRKREEME